ncbi:MAG: DUF262 domain-containing protein [Saprospiraceae bacterium]|nr:DUF262 domain-containing protein [Saprospiraceae bacterium]
MENSIKEIFEAESQSVLSTLSRAGTAYQIPSYQRNYSWKESNIFRLIEDISYGIKELSNDNDTLSFLGTFIVTPLKVNSSMPSNALSIVDGQQRLTTIVLILAILHENIRVNSGTLGKSLDDKGFQREAIKNLQKLKKCLFEEQGISDDAFDLQPVIIRDTDNWASDEYSCVYNSAVAALLNNYAIHLNNKVSDAFSFKLEYEKNENENECKEYEELNSRLEYIKSLLDQAGNLYNDHESLFIGDVIKQFLNTNIQKELFIYMDDLSEIDEFKLKDLSKVDENVLFSMIFSKYIMDKVVLTKVVASEKYAFDVFESLNTTGEPLTAIETFRPKLIDFINKIKDNNKAYLHSGSKKHLDSIEKYIELKGENKKQKESQDLVHDLALLHSGKDSGTSLSVQRKYLRDQISTISTEQEVTLLVARLDELVRFKIVIWDNDNLEDQLKSYPDRDIVLTCSEFLRSAKKTLTIPILTRYYSEALRSSSFEQFSNVIKALTAFTLLWRTAFGGTKGIDGVYREIMCYGYKKKKKIKVEALHSPVSYQNENLPSYLEICHVLHKHLEAKGLDSFNGWYKFAKVANVYGASGPIAKMFLLLANHKTIWDSKDEKLVKKARTNFNEFMSLEVWNSKRSFSIEHVAPQSINKASTWDTAIYEDIHTVNTIGNLTLLPQKENSAVANSNWDQKKVYFNCFLQSDKTELYAAIECAKLKGFTIPKKTVKELINGDYLDFLTPIVLQPSWSKFDIDKRTHNICELLWSEVSDWLNLT